MDIMKKENMARMLAGNYVKKLCTDNDLYTDDDIEEFVETNDEACTILREILETYIYEMNSEED